LIDRRVELVSVESRLCIPEFVIGNEYVTEDGAEERNVHARILEVVLEIVDH